MHKFTKLSAVWAALLLCLSAHGQQPNILWIVAEDLSPFMGCYGDSVNKHHTPVLDKLASEGVLFTHAYASAPVCSASRSAFITGVMQTTTGTHNHRSSRYTNGEVVPEKLRIHLPKPIKTLPELMRKAGYFTFNSGKDDYNFHYNRNELYSVGQADDYKPGMNGWQGNWAKHRLSITQDTWNARKDKRQPWFGQIQINGGKDKDKFVRQGEKLADDAVPLPPYFPKTPALQHAWTVHYNANRGADARVEAILKQLEADGELDNTIIFFFADHGSNTSLRHKQFCYEGGLHVPLIIRGKHPKIKAQTVRKELVSLLDLAATTLALAQLPLPSYLDGQNLFATNYSAPTYVYGARDRCDYTIDKIRTVRSEKYRYIRNYFTDRPLMQAGYRDNKPMVKDMKRLYKEGKLTRYQSEHWFGIRPHEELYKIDSDVHQMNNLALDPHYKKILKKHRKALERWIRKSGDKGQQPEDTVQLRATYEMWKDRPRFRDAKVNPEYDQF